MQRGNLGAIFATALSANDTVTDQTDKKIPQRKPVGGLISAHRNVIGDKQTDLFVWLFVLAGASQTFLLPSFSFCKEKRESGITSQPLQP